MKLKYMPVLAKGLAVKQMGDLTTAKALFNHAVTIAPAQYKDQIQQLAQTTVPPVPNLINPPDKTLIPPSSTPTSIPTTSSTSTTSNGNQQLPSHRFRSSNDYNNERNNERYNQRGNYQQHDKSRSSKSLPSISSSKFSKSPPAFTTGLVYS